MIKCTGENCTRKQQCMRYGADAVISPHFEGNQQQSHGCTFYMPDPVKDPDDDLGVPRDAITNPINMEE